MFGWMAYIILTPLYIFDVGLPQPADIILVCVAGLAVGLAILKSSLPFDRVMMTLTLMVGLIMCINITHALHYGDARFYYSCAYYVFNALAFTTTILLYRQDPDHMIRMVRYAFLTAIVFEVLWMMVMPSHSPTRATGSFLNPNQLGYWALLSSAVLVTLNTGRKMPIIDLITLAACAFMIAESLSRAAIFSFILVIIPVFFGRTLSMTMRVGMICVVLITLLTQLIFPSNTTASTDNDFIQTISTRLNIFDHASDPEKFSERGYNRLWDYPEYLIIGAGEGAYWRFMDSAVVDGWSGMEIHSGLATLLFSYGIFGFALFCMFVLMIFRHAPPTLWFCLAAIMLYGLTHQHIRFTTFWIYLGISYGFIRYGLPHRTHTP